MDSSLNVDVSFRQLLHNICVQFSLPPPRYRMTVHTDGRLCSHVDVEVSRSSRFMEIIICHGAPFSEANQTQENAACVAIKRLSNELSFEVRDVNLEDKKYYKNLYDRISDEHLELQDEYEMINLDFELLKKSYNFLIEEKKQIVAALKEMKESIGRCCAFISPPNVDPMEEEPTRHPTTSNTGETTASTSDDPETPSVVSSKNFDFLYSFVCTLLKIMFTRSYQSKTEDVLKQSRGKKKVRSLIDSSESDEEEE
uniref:Uncharacterized protein n=1 Tax=Ananas comosus var. bracteatus TaxID=296719 RepID=A0A6V7PLB1_ANACO|nr:unnamed protein product [Ananas comosus var. bracteatus]